MRIPSLARVLMPDRTSPLPATSILVAFVGIAVLATPARAQDAADPSRGFWGALADTTPLGAVERRDPYAGWWATTREGTKHVWSAGDHDVYLFGYAWHMPWKYGPSKQEFFNSQTWGFGYGHSLTDAGGRLRTLYVAGSLDSYEKPQFMAGYMWRARWRPGNGALRLTGGYTGLLISRHDYANYTPLPLILPVGSVGIRYFEVVATYVPVHEIGLFFCRISLPR